MATITPQGIQDSWQACIAAADATEWDALAFDLLESAAHEPDDRARDDVLTLSMVACCLADDADRMVAFSLTPLCEREGVAA